MPYADMAVYRAAVMMPWDLNLVWPADVQKADLQQNSLGPTWEMETGCDRTV